MESYSIIRFFKNEGMKREVIEEGLTLEEAQTHCKRDDTQGENFFDGYEKE